MKSHFRRVIEAIVASILFFHQRVWLSRGAFPMLLPLIKLILYLPTLIMHPERLRYEDWRLFTIAGGFSLIIVFVGFLIFIRASFHFLKRRGGLITTGLYSLVRHPQYLGITLMALGSSILFRGYTPDLLFAVLGYLLLAGYEERNLQREHGETYLEYKQRTPFIFPIPCPSNTNEFLFSIFIALLIFLPLIFQGS